MRRGLAAIAFALIATGCHTFRPTTLDDLTPGQDVRARVTGAYSDSLRAILGDDALEFEGSYVERSGSSIFVDVTVASGYQGMRLETLNQRIRVPESELVVVEHKELSKGRTAMALGVIAGIGAGFLYAQLNKDTGGGVIGGNGGPVEAVVGVPSVGLVGAILRVWPR